MSLIATLSQELRSAYSNRYDKNEIRPSEYGALRAAQEDTAEAPIFDGETSQKLLVSYGNTVVVPVLDSETVTLTVPYVRTCAIVDSENTSALVNLAFQAYGWGFSMTPATHENNDVKYVDDYVRKSMKHLLPYASTLDELVINLLETEKNQYFPADLLSYYAVVAGAFQVPNSVSNDFYNQLGAIMNTMDFYDTIRVITSTKHIPLVSRLQAQGPANAINETFQFPDNKYKWYPTNRIPNGTAVSAGYAVQRGSLYIANRNDHDTRTGGSIGGDFKVWGQEVMPVVNMNMGVFYQQDCADRSAIGGAATAGNTRSRVEGFEVSTDVMVAFAYNSDIANRYQPNVKFEITNA